MYNKMTFRVRMVESDDADGVIPIKITHNDAAPPSRWIFYDG